MAENAMNQDPTLLEVYADVRDSIDRAYAAGFEAGCVATRDRIMQAVQQPIIGDSHFANAPQPTRATEVELTDQGSNRAPRGALRSAIQEVLRKWPGSLEKFLHTEMPRINTRVSGNSVGGELRRMKDVLYHQDGYRWFNIESSLSRASTDFGGQTGADTPVTDTEENKKNVSEAAGSVSV